MLPVTVLVTVCSGDPPHVGWLGPKSLKLILPVGAAPPESVTSSAKLPPPAPDAGVGVSDPSVGDTLAFGVTTKKPAEQAVLEPLLPPFPP